MQDKQRKVPGHRAESPNLLHGAWSLERLSPDLFWKKGGTHRVLKEAPWASLCEDALLDTVNQETDPGSLNLGNGAERLKPRWPSREARPLMLQRSLKDSVFLQKRRLLVIQKPGAHG